MLGAPTACGSLALNVSASANSPVESSSDEAIRFMEASLSIADPTIDPRSAAIPNFAAQRHSVFTHADERPRRVATAIDLADSAGAEGVPISS